MPPILIDLCKLWRMQRFECLNADRIVCKTPGFLVYAHLGNDGSSGEKVDIYDGENSNEQKLCSLRAPAYGSDNFSPSLPAPFLRGLFIDVNSANSLVTLVIITHRE